MTTADLLAANLDAALLADMAAGKSALGRIGDILVRWGGADEHSDVCGCRACDAGLYSERVAGQRDGWTR